MDFFLVVLVPLWGAGAASLSGLSAETTPSRKKAPLTRLSILPAGEASSGQAPRARDAAPGRWRETKRHHVPVKR